jgi:UDP-2,4-diacetamido-2,4,6-trideoxy-beta-L-altropyranose hydrolase
LANATRSGEASLAVFRFEAGPGTGLGHATRCLALADALADLGWTCRFAASETALKALGVLAGSRAYSAIPDFECGDPEAEAAQLRAAMPDGCDLVVVDDYRIGDRFERALRSWAGRTLAIDDAPTRPHAADMLLDQSEGRRPGDYAALVAPECRLLVGAAYALLRPDFRRHRRAALQRHLAQDAGIVRVLVALGGVAGAPLLGLIVRGVRKALPAARIDLVAGLTEIPAELAADGLVHVHDGPPDMASLMANANLAVGAGGVSCWERCCLGLPSLVVGIAENQRTVISALTCRRCTVARPYGGAHRSAGYRCRYCARRRHRRPGADGARRGAALRRAGRTAGRSAAFTAARA